MSPKSLKTLLVHAFTHSKKVLIKGPPGIGKTEIVYAATREVNFRLLVSHPAISDPTDYKGMPSIVKSGTEAVFLPFGDLLELINATEPTVFFLDDLGQAPHSVQAATMQLLTRRINGNKISDKVVFCGATNDTSHRAGVNSLLEPVKSRWDTIVQLDTSLDDWCEWAYTNDMPPELIAFLRLRPELLNKFEPTRELTNSPSPRTAAAVGAWIKSGVEDYEVIEGAAGAGFASEFVGFLRVFKSMPSIDSIIADPAGSPVPSDPATLFAVSAALVRRLGKTGPHVKAIFAYADRLPEEFTVFLVRDALRSSKTLTQTPEFIAWASKNQAFLE